MSRHPSLTTQQPFNSIQYRTLYYYSFQYRYLRIILRFIQAVLSIITLIFLLATEEYSASIILGSFMVTERVFQFSHSSNTLPKLFNNSNFILKNFLYHLCYFDMPFMLKAKKYYRSNQYIR